MLSSWPRSRTPTWVRLRRVASTFPRPSSVTRTGRSSPASPPRQAPDRRPRQGTGSPTSSGRTPVDRYDPAVTQTWLRNPDVIATDLDEELVLLHPSTRAVFTLNATGRTIWQQLAEPRDLATLLAAVTDEFEIDATTAGTDVTRLLGELTAADLARLR